MTEKGKVFKRCFLSGKGGGGGEKRRGIFFYENYIERKPRINMRVKGVLKGREGKVNVLSRILTKKEYFAFI